MLPVKPDYEPMEAELAEVLPIGPSWQYEPKWDGFRCLIFRDADQVKLISKSGRPLERYFPELKAAVASIAAERCILDAEIVIPAGGDAFSFDDLLQRIHPAQSRINKLAKTTPGVLLVFDILTDEGGQSYTDQPLSTRRQALENFAQRFLSGNPHMMLSPATTDPEVTELWRQTLGNRLDGIIAKRLDLPYQSGTRKGMVKVKKMRTADCVVGGFRYASGGKAIGSLLLGLYDDNGLLDHVGFTSSFNRKEKQELLSMVEPLIAPPGFTGRAPGGPSRWSSERSEQWEPLSPVLVVEVRYDHFTQGRFRHGTHFMRFRVDKRPDQCGYDQIHL